MILLAPIIVSIPFPFSPIQIIILELLLDVAALGGFLYEREEAGIMSTRINGKRSIVSSHVRPLQMIPVHFPWLSRLYTA